MKTILILSLVVMTTCCLSGSFLGTSFPEVFGTKAAATETGDDLAPGFDIEPGGDVLPPVTSSTTTPTQAPTEISFENYTPEPIPTERWGEIFTTINKNGVSNGAISPEFTLPLQGPAFCRATKILTYHWNNGNGVTPGMIALQGSDGSFYGPYQASGEDGMGGVKNANWVVYVDIVLMQQVTYTVIDSDPATWAQNSGTGGAGMAIVWGACSQ